MSRSNPSRTPNRRAGAIAIAIALIALAAAVYASAAQPHKRVAAKAENATLGKTVLTTLSGRTLYSLSAETRGKFICTGACLREWFPLTVPAGTKPTGPVKLGSIERSDNGRTQVTYKGKPLYRFAGDGKRGDANGEGIKDVGTWHAATVAGGSDPAPGPQPQPENPYPPYPYRH